MSNIFEITDEEIVSVKSNISKIVMIDSISNLSLNKEITESENSDNETNNISDPTKLTQLLQKINSKIVFHNPDTQSWNEALVLGKAGKSTGRNRTWLNVKSLGDNSHQSVDFSNMKVWKNVEEEGLVTSHSYRNIDILRPKSVELENWQKHCVYDEVNNIGQIKVSARWVVSQEYKNEDVPYKGRLVTWGFEEENLDEIGKDSPTCCKENLCVLLLLIIANKWKIRSLDIKLAFLQSNKNNCEVYLKPPVEAGTSKLWKLNISVYGLCHALCSWYLSLKSVLLRAGAMETKFDDSVFFWSVNNKSHGVMSCHVHDFWLARLEKPFPSVKKKLQLWNT